MNRRWRERPMERDPETGEPKEPIPDTEYRERQQFLAGARAKARSNYRPEHGDRDAYMAAASRNARIDWGRREESERLRQFRTESIEVMLSEPTIPGFLENLTVTDELDSILKQIDALWQRALRLRYLEGHSIPSLAEKLQRTPRSARSIVEKAIKEAKRVAKR